MRSTYQPKYAGLLSGTRAQGADLWRAYPDDVAAALRGLGDLSPALTFSTFGGGEIVFPRVGVRAEGPEPLRLGLFGGFEAEEAGAIARLGRLPLDLREEDGLLNLRLDARAYPVANPLAFTDSRRALSGGHLRSRLWHGAERADVYYLERELGTHEFHVLCVVAADPEEPASLSVSRPLLRDEVTGPLLARRGALEVAAAPWRAEWSLLDNASISPAPVEFRINYPLAADPGRRNLARLVADLLRAYRAFLSFQENI